MINQSPDPSVRYQSTPTVRTALVDLAAQRLTGQGHSSRWL